MTPCQRAGVPITVNHRHCSNRQSGTRCAQLPAHWPSKSPGYAPVVRRSPAAWAGGWRAGESSSWVLAHSDACGRRQWKLRPFLRQHCERAAEAECGRKVRRERRESRAALGPRRGITPDAGVGRATCSIGDGWTLSQSETPVKRMQVFDECALHSARPSTCFGQQRRGRMDALDEHRHQG